MRKKYSVNFLKKKQENFSRNTYKYKKKSIPFEFFPRKKNKVL